MISKAKQSVSERSMKRATMNQIEATSRALQFDAYLDLFVDDAAIKKQAMTHLVALFRRQCRILIRDRVQAWHEAKKTSRFDRAFASS